MLFYFKLINMMVVDSPAAVMTTDCKNIAANDE
jgi:hypothetical protein